MEYDNIIELLTAQASRLLPTGAKLILFGSRARGTANEHSDWDILILLDKDRHTLSDLDHYVLPFRELGWNINQEINPIIATYKELDSKAHSIPLYFNIKNEGLTIWG